MNRLLSGRLPFGAPTVLATLQSIQNDIPAPPSSIDAQVSADLSDLAMSLLEKQPANRPESARQVIAMINSDRRSWQTSINRYTASTKRDGKTGSDNNRTGASSSHGVSSRWWQAALVMLICGAAWWWSPQIIRIATDQGEVMIESTDDNVEIQIFQNGKLMRVVDTQNGGSFDLHSGSYTLRATTTEAGQGTEENAFQVTPATLVMLRGGRQIVKVTQPRSSVAKTTVEQSSGQGRAERKLTASKNQLHTGFHKVTEPAKPIDAQPSHKHGIATTFGPLNSQPQFPLKYGGKSFDQWFEIAKYDRSEKSCVEALVACGEIAIKQQRDKLMELTREIVQHRSETKFDTHNRQILTDGQPRFTQVLRNVVLTFPRRRPLLSLLEKLPTVQKRADSFVVFGSRHSRGKKGSTT